MVEYYVYQTPSLDHEGQLDETVDQLVQRLIADKENIYVSGIPGRQIQPDWPTCPWYTVTLEQQYLIDIQHGLDEYYQMPGVIVNMNDDTYNIPETGIVDLTIFAMNRETGRYVCGVVSLIRYPKDYKGVIVYRKPTEDCEVVPLSRE